MKFTALLLTTLILFFFSALQPPLGQAFTMSDSSFILRMGNLNSAAGTSTGNGKSLGLTLGELAPGLSASSRYKVRSGFQYIHSLIPFAFSIDTTTISFGTLDPHNSGTYVQRTNTLTVSNGSANGYIVTGQENHPLLDVATGAQIPDTTCDGGTCSETTSGTWASPLTFGFGYRCDTLTANVYCGSGFGSSTSFKQFANTAQSETPQTVMYRDTTLQATRSAQVKITYQLNIANTQPGGNYTNVIMYIATPTF